MISVFVHNSFINEKRYVLDFVFNEVLQTEYELITDNIATYRIVDANKRLVIADSFFASMNEGYPYYRDENLVPEKVEFVTYVEYIVGDIPLLFGSKEIRSEDGFLFLENDIFATIFFMLTRWEEIAVDKFDKHGRFLESENLSVKCGFNLRPIVNEYLEFIKILLDKSEIETKVINRKFQIYFTHDIDDIARYDKGKKIIKALIGDLIKRKSLNTFFCTLKDVYRIRIKKHRDVYNTFDFLMKISENRGVKSHFYFIPGLLGEEDVRFDIRSKTVLEIVDIIKAKNHIVGIHPSYSTFCNIKQLNIEKQRLEKYNVEIAEGRQHYLRFKNPETWQHWDDCGIKIDSTIGFYEQIGFRSGICFEYPVFNVVSREKLSLRERPLIVMDTALRRFAVTKEKSLQVALEIAEITKKYNGDFVLLWHNSNLSVNEWHGWDQVYKTITESL
jgi:hypothetical protein